MVKGLRHLKTLLFLLILSPKIIAIFLVTKREDQKQNIFSEHCNIPITHFVYIGKGGV